MIKYSLQYDYEFLTDIKNITDWYDEINTEITDKFLNELWLVINIIGENPFAFVKVTKDFHRTLLETFPYKLYYKIVEDNIFLVALIHSSRSNKYIKRRLK